MFSDEKRRTPPRAAWLIAATLGIAVLAMNAHGAETTDPKGPAATSPIPLAVLGDSDAHSYQDTVSFPPGKRFGAFQALTFQWPEVLARLRPQRFDLGEWGVRGTRRSVAEAMDWVGLGGRFPRKQDYLHNLAFSGATCDSLMGYNGRLARRAVAQMDRQPDAWRRGIVVIDLGVNDFGHADSLDLLAQDPAHVQVQAKIAHCLGAIKSAIALIHKSHPATRIVVAGTLGDVPDPSMIEHWRSARAISNVLAGLDVFNRGLMAIAQSDARIAYADMPRWFTAHWGGRDERGEPKPKTVLIGGRFAVTWSAGDDPKNVLTADEHPGVVWNALWAQELVDIMNAKFNAGIKPITDEDVAEFLQPAIAASR